MHALLPGMISSAPRPFFLLSAALWLLGSGSALAAPRPELGGFEAETDVGGAQPGVTKFDPARKEFRITGAGENMWEARDAFHYVWKRASGDLSASTDVSFAEKTGNEHRKGGWVVRQGLEPDAPYADAIVHADGLLSLQYRLVKGGPTLEVQSPIRGPATVKLERTGDLFTMFVARAGKPFAPVGSVTVKLADPVYVGLGVCSHEAKSSATVLFPHSALVVHGPVAADKRVLESNLEVLTIKTGERRVVLSTH